VAGCSGGRKSEFGLVVAAIQSTDRCCEGAIGFCCAAGKAWPVNHMGTHGAPLRAATGRKPLKEPASILDQSLC
jgi:hypothetical protein